jgi:hypothetical protein
MVVVIEGEQTTIDSSLSSHVDELVIYKIELFIYAYLYTLTIYDKNNHQYEYNMIVLHSWSCNSLSFFKLRIQ